MPPLCPAHGCPRLACTLGDTLLSTSSPSRAVSPTQPCPPSRTARRWPTSAGTPLTHGASLLVRALCPGCALWGTVTLPWHAAPRITTHPLPVSLRGGFGAAAGEDAKIRLWRVPEGGLQDTLREPEAVLQGERGAGAQLKHRLSQGVQAEPHGQRGLVASLSQCQHSALLTRAHGEDLLHPLPPRGG